MKEGLPIEEAIRKTFLLRGEEVIRLSTGRPVGRGKPTVGYQTAQTKIDGKWRPVQVHRIKFFLTHGFLPPLVDHRDGDRLNNRSNNLRAATRTENQRNLKAGPLRGVRCRRSGRWSAYGLLGGKQVSLGTFSTVEEALEAADSHRRGMHGEFFRERQGINSIS